MNSAAYRSTLLLVGLAATATASATERDDWRCDRPAHFNAPVGCALWGAQLDKGMCTSYTATGSWTCQVPWTPLSRTDERDLMFSEIKSMPSISLPLPSEFALKNPSDSSRSLRLLFDTRKLSYLPGSINVLELQAADEKRTSVTIAAERSKDGGFELVVRAEGITRPLARLLLRDGASSVLVTWKLDPINGPQLQLASGRNAVEVGLEKLDAHTRLQLWQSMGVEQRFDVMSPVGSAPTEDEATEALVPIQR
jgi:hypothetical protein